LSTPFFRNRWPTSCTVILVRWMVYDSVSGATLHFSFPSQFGGRQASGLQTHVPDVVLMIFFFLPLQQSRILAHLNPICTQLIKRSSITQYRTLSISYYIKPYPCCFLSPTLLFMLSMDFSYVVYISVSLVCIANVLHRFRWWIMQ